MLEALLSDPIKLLAFAAFSKRQKRGMERAWRDEQATTARIDRGLVVAVLKPSTQQVDKQDKLSEQ